MVGAMSAEATEASPQHFTYVERSGDVVIQVEPMYVPEKSNPDAPLFLFAYCVRITNHGKKSWQLLSRHWIIRDGAGREEHVEGDGVIGRQPEIDPGEAFQYVSFCPLPTPTGNMRGTYLLQSSDQDSIEAKVPLFFFRTSGSLH